MTLKHCDDGVGIRKLEIRLVKNDEQSCKNKLKIWENPSKIWKLATLKIHKTEIVETGVEVVSLPFAYIFLFSVIMWPVVIKIWCAA